MPTTVRFDEEKQKRKIEELHRSEQEALAELLSHKYNLEYINLTKVPINTDALRLVPQETAMAANLAVFNILGKRISVGTISPERGIVIETIEELKSRG